MDENKKSLVSAILCFVCAIALVVLCLFGLSSNASAEGFITTTEEYYTVTVSSQSYNSNSYNYLRFANSGQVEGLYIGNVKAIDYNHTTDVTGALYYNVSSPLTFTSDSFTPGYTWSVSLAVNNSGTGTYRSFNFNSVKNTVVHDGAIGNGLDASLGFVGEALDFILDYGWIVGLPVGLALVGFGIDKLKGFFSAV